MRDGAPHASPAHRGDTIAALATAPGAAAVSVVRLSGPDALTIARRVTGIDPRPRHAELCDFNSIGGERIDRGLMLFFPAPGSYTGEDVVELQGHGAPVLADWLLETLHALGARPAEPGEFTLRAFLNDKLDLAQAEAVADLVASGTRGAAQAALRSLSGNFSGAVTAVQAELTALRVHVEAWLDFPDEEIDRASSARLAAQLDAVLAQLDDLLAAAAHGRVLRDGLAVVIAGPPNAGKSSLLNRMAGYDAAIVTNVPGTTRDTLREHLSLDGLPVHIVDTAGLRKTHDPIEAEGVQRARRALEGADRVLWVADVRDGLELALAAARAETPVDVPFTVLLNKVDLVGDIGSDGVGSDAACSSPAGSGAIDSGKAGSADNAAREYEHDGVPVIVLSALTGAGFELLPRHLKTVAGVSPEATSGTFSARRRHVDALERAAARLRAARAELDAALELAAEELRAAQSALGELTGELTSDDLLGEIFSGFCIGK